MGAEVGTFPPGGLRVSLKVRVGDPLGSGVWLGGKLRGKGGGKASVEQEVGAWLRDQRAGGKADLVEVTLTIPA